MHGNILVDRLGSPDGEVENWMRLRYTVYQRSTS